MKVIGEVEQLKRDSSENGSDVAEDNSGSRVDFSNGDD